MGEKEGERKQEERDRRVAEEMLRRRMRQEAQETISRLLEAKRTSKSYEHRRSIIARDEFLDNFPDSQTGLELDMFPIYEEVLSEELRKAISRLVAEQEW